MANFYEREAVMGVLDAIDERLDSNLGRAGLHDPSGKPPTDLAKVWDKYELEMRAKARERRSSVLGYEAMMLAAIIGLLAFTRR